MPPLPSLPPLPHAPLPRIITYYQTFHRPGTDVPVSILPLVTQPAIELTHLIIAARMRLSPRIFLLSLSNFVSQVHINQDADAPTLNDHHPCDARFDSVWAEARLLQASGIRVMCLLGGAAKGTYAKLDGDDATFEAYYKPLATIVRRHALDGLDLDVEEDMSLAGIIRLIDRLRADFGPDFLITLAPVAAALLDARYNLSGFDYEALEVLRGREIAWYNAQFYCGWGECSNPVMYEMVLAKGWPPEKVVVGLVTNPENGSGWVPWNTLATVLPVLAGSRPRFGGVMGWEFFNSLPGGMERPWEWARAMTALLRGCKTAEADGDAGADAGADGGNAPESVPPPPADFDYFTDEGEDA